jgi:hypothetical protein
MLNPELFKLWGQIEAAVKLPRQLSNSPTFAKEVSISAGVDSSPHSLKKEPPDSWEPEASPRILVGVD